MVAPVLSLESRIAAMLSVADAKSDAVAALLTDVELAAQEADVTATKTREEALDPAIVVDAAKVGAAVATATLTRDRLQAALPRLQEQLRQTRQAEAVAAWRAEAEELDARRIALMTEFAEFYPAMEKRIVDHLYTMRALDREINEFNSRRPDGSITPLALSTPAFTVDLQIPDPYDKKRPLWPPPQLTLGQQMARAMLAGTYPMDSFADCLAWPDRLEERHRRALEDNRRQIAEAEQRQREREEREQAEIAKIKQADRMARAAG
jgi:hypothetical protein